MRAKIILPNLAAVLFLGLIGYFYLNSSLDKRSLQGLTDDLKVTARLFDRSEALRGYELLTDVRQQAMTKVVTGVFEKLDIQPTEGESQESYENRIRQVWFKRAVKSVETYSEMWAIKNRKPALVFITDRNGVVLARNTTPNACPTGKQVSDAIPVVQRALDGEAGYGVWSLASSPFSKNAGEDTHICSLMNTGLLEVAASPIWVGDDEVAGALVIGFEVSNGVAAENSKALGVDVAVIASNNVYSTSFTTDTARQNLNGVLARTDVARKVNEAFATGSHSEIFPMEIEGEDYLVMVAPVINSDPKDRIAFVYMGSLDSAQYYKQPLLLTLVIMGISILFVLFAGFLLANYFMKPIVAIEEGILKIINGEYDYRFDVESSEVGGLSYRINQLVNVLTEQDETNDDSS